MSLRSRVEVCWLGEVDYKECLALQRALREQRLAGDLRTAGGDVLLLCTHPPVVSRGRRGRSVALPASSSVPVVDVERGGGVTWHGPGQLLAYPIISLPAIGVGVPRFVCALERAGTASLAALGVAVRRRDGWPGLWSEGDPNTKLASTGTHFRRFVSMHGIALNLERTAASFAGIVPCGLEGVRAGFVSDYVSVDFQVSEVAREFADGFAADLGCALRWIEPADLSGRVPGVSIRMGNPTSIPP